MHLYICPECGAYLDPGERCDCIEDREAKARRDEERDKELRKLFIMEDDGQLKIAV